MGKKERSGLSNNFSLDFAVALTLGRRTVFMA